MKKPSFRDFFDQFLCGPGQNEIPRVPSISDTLAKFMRALHDKSIKDPYNLDDVVDKTSKLHTRGFNAEVDNAKIEEKKVVIEDRDQEVVQDFDKGGFDVPESNLDPDALSWE